MKRTAALIISAAATMLVGACGGASTGGSAAPSGPPQRGGTLHYGLSAAPTCSDPAQGGTNQTLYLTRQIVDSLTDQDPATGQIKPWLASSWQVGPDARTFTFHLRTDVTFSDGTPLTAQVVQHNFDAIVHTLTGAKAPLAASYLSGYTGTRVIDSATAEVDFAEPNAQFLQASSTSQLGILADVTTAQSPEQRCTGRDIGSGPFTYADYKQGVSATLARRAGYHWSSGVFGNHGEAYLDRIEFRVVPESGVRIGSLTSGQLDAVSDTLPQDIPQVQAAGDRVQISTNPGVPFGLQPNISRAPLNDPAVRTALVHGIDRKQLVDTVLGPQFTPATGVLGVKTPAYLDLSKDLTYDPALAQRTLSQAGWQPGSDGIRVKNGQRLAFGVLFSSSFPANQAILELVQQQVRKIGVELTLQPASDAEDTARQNARDFDTIYYNVTRADGDILRTQFGLHDRNLNARGPIPALDDALAGELSAADPAARATLIRQAQQQVIANGLWVPTIELSQPIGVAAHTGGLQFDASTRLEFYDAWIQR